MTQKVVLFDLWMTLVHGLTTDPIHSLQGIVKYRAPGEPLDPAFLAKCLTTNVKNPSRFLHEVMGHFGQPVPRGAISAFRKLIAQERQAATAYDDTFAVLSQLKEHGYRIGLISNLWPFPVHHIFNGMALGSFFEHMVYSFEAGVAKPNREPFDRACQLFGVDAEHCIMIGDSVSSDIQGALGAGMRAILIDRSGKAKSLVPVTVPVVSSLTEVKVLLI